MFKSKSYWIMLWLASLLLLQLFVLSFKFNILLQIASFFLFYFIYKTGVSLDFIKLLKPLFIIFFIAFIGTFTIGGYNTFNIIKDILHVLKPILGLLIGYLFVKEMGDEKKFVKFIILLGLISALYHFFIVFFKTDLSSGTIAALRYNAKDSFLEIISLFLLVYYRKFFGEAFSDRSRNYYIVLGILSFSIVLYFSRTMYVILLIFILSFNGFTVINKRNIKIVIGLIVAIALLYIYLFSIKINPRDSRLDGFLYKIKIAPEEVFDTRLKKDHIMYLGENWRAYEVKRAYKLMEKNPQSFVWGTGFGSLVNLKFYAPIGDYKKGMKYISELHNGYMYIFYKTGIIGLISFMVFLFYLYNFINLKNADYLNTIISTLGLSLIFSSMVFSGFYNYRDVYAIVLGGFLYFYFKRQKAILK